MRKKITKIRIPLDSFNEEEQKQIRKDSGGIIIVISDEPCLTCGHKKRIQYIERTDGKREVVRECIYCLCSVHTLANRLGP